MLVENMKMALTSLRANKMRSALTMLGIIIGIGSVISIVSIGDTMRKMFADIAKNVGVTQGAISIGYWLDDSEYRDTDYFSMEEMERIQELFSDRMVYTDSYASERGEARNNRRKLKLSFFGVKEKYWEVQPAILLEGRYLNEADLRERRENAVVNVETARKLFGSEHAVGQTFRSELGREIREFRVVGVYRQEVSPFQKLLSGNNDDSGEAYIPESLCRFLTAPPRRSCRRRRYRTPRRARHEAAPHPPGRGAALFLKIDLTLFFSCSLHGTEIFPGCQSE